MSKINSLTPEQQADWDLRIEKWRKIGLSCEPLDYNKAKPLVCKLYEACGYKSPKMVFHCQSPFQASLEAALLSSNNLWANLRDNLGANLRDNLGVNLGANLWDNLRTNLRDNLEANLRDNLEANLRDNLGTNLWDNLGDNLRDNLGTNLRDNLRVNLGDNLWDNLGVNLGTNLRDNLGVNLGTNLRDNLGTNLRDNLGDNLGVNLGDNLWDNLRVNLGTNLRDNVAKYKYQLIGNLSYWFMQAEFCVEGLKCPIHTNLGGFDASIVYCDLIKLGGWILPTQTIAFLQDRPLEMYWEGIRLHNSKGPAVIYRDGWSVYMWRGRRVSKSVIMDPVTVDRIEKEQNSEIRRVLVERYGTANYIRDSRAQLIHSDEYGTLYKKDEPNDEPIYSVKVICPSTGREYFLGIDPSVYNGLAGRNARAAVASTWRRKNGSLVFAHPSEYAPLVET